MRDENPTCADRNPKQQSYRTDDTGDLVVSEGSSGPTREKSFVFALAMISLYKRLQKMNEFVVSKQLLRSGTSVGANIEEAVAASSRRDFLHKMTIASKEARESVYWLRLLDESDLVPDLCVGKELESARENGATPHSYRQNDQGVLKVTRGRKRSATQN